MLQEHSPWQGYHQFGTIQAGDVLQPPVAGDGLDLRPEPVVLRQQRLLLFDLLTCGEEEAQ